MSNKQEAVFSKSIISAYYFNDAYDTIEILYKLGDNIHSYVVEADPKQADYKDLVAEGWDTDRIMEETYTRIQNFNNNAAEVDVENLLTHVLSEDPDALFKFKLSIFSNDAIKLNKAETKNMRKAKSVLECCALLCKK